MTEAQKITVTADQLERWIDSLAEWDNGAETAIAEMEALLGRSEQSSDAVGQDVTYGEAQDAYNQRKSEMLHDFYQIKLPVTFCAMCGKEGWNHSKVLGLAGCFCTECQALAVAEGQRKSTEEFARMLENNEGSEPGLGFAVAWWCRRLLLTWAVSTVLCAIAVFLFNLGGAFISLEPPTLFPTWQNVRAYLVMGVGITIWRVLSKDSDIRKEWADAKQPF